MVNNSRSFAHGFLSSGVLLLCSGVLALAGADRLAAATGEFIFTSDVHYGITRGTFRGAANVDSQVVNDAMIDKMNRLPMATLPKDDGVKAGTVVGPIDFVTITGDLTNREELYPLPIQSSAASWAQFEKAYYGRLALKAPNGGETPLYLVPGNHDVSNAIGFHAQMKPATDATAMAELYNRMVKPAQRRTKETYNYATDKVDYSRDVAGVHCIFLTVWPDSNARAWMEADLKNVSADTPVFLFAHDNPDVDARHLINPNGDHSINRTDRFENLLSDTLQDGTGAESSTAIEQRAFVTFLKQHKNIVAYFHGHSNWTEFYTWKGPDKDIALPTFRSDSPMKGKFSAKEEAKLAFQLVIYDTTAKKMTVRECLWNTPENASESSPPVTWGQTITVSIAPGS